MPQHREIIFKAKQMENGRWCAVTTDNMLMVSGFKEKLQTFVECRALARFKYPTCEKVIVDFPGDRMP